MTATRYELSGAVATITLARPESRNVLSHEMLNSMGDHLHRALGDEAARVVVLTHEGPAFCAGANLKSAGGSAPRHDLVEVLELILDASKPVVARIAGHCMGGGVGLAAACDISVAADEAQFGFTEVRIGVAPAIISVVCLPKMRRADALELFLSGERVPARRAVEVGLISRAVPALELDAGVASVVRNLLSGGPKALGVTKNLVMRVPTLSRREAFEWTRQRSAELFASEEAAEGIAAFRELRRPRWAIALGAEDVRGPASR